MVHSATSPAARSTPVHRYPKNMIAIDVPAATYVVVTQRGPLSDQQHGLDAILNYVYRTWLPKSGYQRAATPDLEWLRPTFSLRSARLSTGCVYANNEGVRR